MERRERRLREEGGRRGDESERREEGWQPVRGDDGGGRDGHRREARREGEGQQPALGEEGWAPHHGGYTGHVRARARGDEGAPPDLDLDWGGGGW